MSFSLAQILLFIIAYLTGLFAIAHLADRGIIPDRITRHPAVYTLSLGVFAGAMASNGVMSLAYDYGYNFLLYYVGVVLMFVLAAVLLVPLLRLCRLYQLASLADVLTFRYGSPAVGAGITLAMCITLLPLLALQIQAVATSIQILAGGSSTLSPEGGHNGLAFLFCVIISVFSMLFGTRHASAQDRNTGLVTAIAFESLIKLAAMLALMLVAVFVVFGSFGDMEQWLLSQPEVSAQLAQPMRGNSGLILLLIFFAGAVCMPHLFHMAFAENTDSRDMRAATWGLPLYLMLLSLPVLPIAWAGIRMGHTLPLDYSALAIGMVLQSKSISAVAFVAGMSAASATIIITTLALANMCLNHLVLPLRPLQIERNQSIYSQLKWLRRALICVLILAGYVLFAFLNLGQSLTQLALVAFTGTLQFLPGIIATPYWPRGNHYGLLAGLLAGFVIWFLAMLLPLAGADIPMPLQILLGEVATGNNRQWATTAIVSLGVNSLLFMLVSIFTRTGEEEKVAADICSMDDLPRPTRKILSVNSAAEFAAQMAGALGKHTAQDEVERALEELQFSIEEKRPYALRRLRRRIETNLSGMLGPSEAHRIVESAIPFVASDGDREREDFYLLERNLEQSKPRLTGLAADLNDLRRHYRKTLDNLPIGACSVGEDGEILMWNQSMVRITGVAESDIIGSLLSSLPLPWSRILEEFFHSDASMRVKTEVTLPEGNKRWLGLHRTATDTLSNNNTLIVVEDMTDVQLLEEELLHSERLASIGRLAAGVAHEIGNPVTGIACLAQNLEYEIAPGEIQHMAQDILKQTERVNRIVESLMHFSHSGTRTSEATLRSINLADCIDEAIHLLSLDRETKPAHFNNRCDRELLVVADGQRLLQVAINLLSNARDARTDGADVRINARADTERVQIDIEDNGCGIPTEQQNQVFEPFFTTKDPGEGTGLGLALVFSIMEDMNGRVSLTSPLGDGPYPGTRFTLQLPRGRYDMDYGL